MGRQTECQTAKTLGVRQQFTIECKQNCQQQPRGPARSSIRKKISKRTKSVAGARETPQMGWFNSAGGKGIASGPSSSKWSKSRQSSSTSQLESKQKGWFNSGKKSIRKAHTNKPRKANTLTRMKVKRKSKRKGKRESKRKSKRK